jgi:DNA polymerase III alpha subunit
VVLGEPTAAAAAAIRFALAGTLLRATPPGPIVGLRLELHDLGARCHEGALERYGHVDGEVGERLRYELDLIRQHGLAGYFLIVWDLMAFARRERIPAQGRGSAANSIVAYVLGLMNVDPLRHKLFVGRFLNEELATLPDIDIDFSREHRERVLQYVYERYGREHAALVSTHITYQARSAVRDVGKALGLPLDALDRLARRPEPPAPPEPLRIEVVRRIVPDRADEP